MLSIKKKFVLLISLLSAGCGGAVPTTTCNIMSDLDKAGAFVGMTLPQQTQIQSQINARIASDFPGYAGTISDYSCVYSGSSEPSSDTQ